MASPVEEVLPAAEKMSFSARQKRRKQHRLATSAPPGGGGGSKTSFSARQKLRKQGELEMGEDQGKPMIGHKIQHPDQQKVSFSQRQKQKKASMLSREIEVASNIDSDYGSSWLFDPDESPSDSPLATAGSASAILADATSAAGAVVITASSGVGPVASAQPFFQIKLGASAKRLVSGAIAGGVSRTVVAPLETIRTHLMVGNTGRNTVKDVFEWIMETEGWKGLFRGNALNVVRVAPAKAIELFTFDTVKRALTPTGEKDKWKAKIPLPISSVAGSSAGIASCIITYPLELVKTRLTVQPKDYHGVLHAFWTIITKEGVGELYRGLTPSIIGVIPYAGSNYFAYDTLRTLYRKATGKKEIDSFATLCIGSAAGAFAASATFPLEVARKQMQVGALKGRVVYKGTLDCLLGILKEKGVAGLYKGLGPSCIKLMPAAGISFMCYEALKKVLIEDKER